jgi:uncharacterized protein (DUF885 family)
MSANDYDNLDLLANSYLQDLLPLDPVLATSLGESDLDAQLPDYSPDGHQARMDLIKTYLARIPDKAEGEAAITRDLMKERLGTELELHESLLWAQDVGIITSPPIQIRQAFDLMPKETADHWDRIQVRLENIGQALEGYKQSLLYGIVHNRVPSRRLVLELSHLVEMTGRSYFHGLAAKCPPPFEDRIGPATVSASNQYLAFARWLREEIAKTAAPKDGVGMEAWQLYCRAINGLTADPEEVYQWGWDELARIEDEMVGEARSIAPGLSLSEVFETLDSDPDRTIEGVEEFRRWNQMMLDSAIAKLDGRYFEIPEPLKKVEAMIAEPGTAAAMYYTAPSQDLRRPGRTWYPVQGQTRFPIWKEVTTVHHEGVPGHHMQIGYVTWLGERLNAFRRILGETSGNVEGWALYAERLMDELGMLEGPPERLGMLASQAFRAARVVTDVGLHMHYRIPKTELVSDPPTHWNFEFAASFIQSKGALTKTFADSEVKRYLGWPAQATSYKLGERIWLMAREQARKQLASSFDLKTFHMSALSLGMVGLDQLYSVLTQ